MILVESTYWPLVVVGAVLQYQLLRVRSAK